MKNERTDEEFNRQLHELIKTQGISSLTVGEIAARLHCSRRRLYAIAHTKEELFLRVAKQNFDAVLRQGYEAAERENDVAKAIAAYLKVGVAAGAQLSVAFLNDLEATKQGRKLFDDYQSARVSGLKHLVDRGVDQGVFAAHNSHVVAEVILGAALRLRRPKFLAQTGLTLEDAFSELSALILDGLLIRKPAQKPSHKSRTMSTSTGTRVKDAKPARHPGKGEASPTETTLTEEDFADRLLAFWTK